MLKPATLFICVFFIANYSLFSQTGPLSSGSEVNNASIGTNAWSTPNQIKSSNNNGASVATKGITQYLQASDFGFAITTPAAINGIQVDIERSTTTGTSVAILNAWSNGFTKTVSAGFSRCLVACVFLENGLGPRDVTSMSYGGQPMTQITEVFVGSSLTFCAKIEYWVLMEAGLSAATNTSFALTFNGIGLLENWESVSSAVYQFVDQSLPLYATSNFTSTSTSSVISLATPVDTRFGGVTISSIICGNNTTPASMVGGTNTYLINSGFTETIDTYSAGASFSTSGGCYQIAVKDATVTGSEAPTYTFAGTPNRQAICCLHLQGLREADNSVRLLKGGLVAGSNYAQTIAAWPIVDTYTSYGGPTDLWGTTWADADINSAFFGVVLSATVQNGTAQVDHVRITVYSSSALPVELTSFTGKNFGDHNRLYWQTATEKNNKLFIIERSDGIEEFKEIGKINGSGTSYVFNNYEFHDTNPSKGINYYRLKQSDHDDTYEYSKNILITNENEHKFEVYPNPSSGQFTLVGKEFLQDGCAVYNNQMQLIKTVCSEPSDYNFSLSDLSDGIYFLVYTTEGKQKIKKIEKTSRSY